MVHPVGLQVGRPDVLQTKSAAHQTKSATHYVSRRLNINTIEKLWLWPEMMRFGLSLYVVSYGAAM